MRDIDIEGIVHLSSKERYAALFGGILIIPCGIVVGWWMFTYIPIWLFLLHFSAFIIGLYSLVGGISLILLAIHPAKIYWIQELSSCIFW